MSPNALTQLKQFLNQNDLIQFEELLDEVSASVGPEDIPQLVTLLPDDEDQDEFGFAVVHLIEHFEDQQYVEHLLRGLSTLWQRSPRWAKILHIRIMNSPQTLEAYRQLLAGASAQDRELVRRILEEVVQWRPKLVDRVQRLLQTV